MIHPRQIIVRVHERALVRPSGANPLGLPKDVNALILAQHKAGVIRRVEPLVDTNFPFFRAPGVPSAAWRELGGERWHRDNGPAPGPEIAPAWRRQIQSELWMTLADDDAMERMIGQFQELASVVYAEPIPLRKISEAKEEVIRETWRRPAPSKDPKPQTVDPINKRFLDGAWGHEVIKWPAGRFELSTPIAIVDSGIDLNHSALQSINNNPTGFYFGSRNPLDTTDHGTAVASVLAARPTTIQGVTPPIAGHPGTVDMTYKGLFTGNNRVITSFNVIVGGNSSCVDGSPKGTICPGHYFSALSIIANQLKPRVVNLSVYSISEVQEPSRTEQAWFQRLSDANIVCVACAGNNFDGWPRVTFPARLPGVISVGAVRAIEVRADFSNYSIPGSRSATYKNESTRLDYHFNINVRKTLVDLMAPGNAIMCASISASRYRFRAGTSFAAPFVSAAVALMLEKKPKSSVEDVRNLLAASCNPPQNPLADPDLNRFRHGGGILDFTKLASNW